MNDPQDNSTKRMQGAGKPVTALATHALETLAQRKGPPRPLLSERLVEQLVQASRTTGNEGIEGAIADILHAGVPFDETLDFYIPEAARRLGDAWCDDRISFADVTIGSSRLQRAVRKLSEEAQGSGRRLTRRSALVVTLEGQTHTLGPMLFSEQLRRHDVSVRLMIAARPRDVLDTVAHGSFDAIFVSVAVVEALASAASLVDKIRSVIAKGVPIMVGGAVCSMGLDVKEVTGADFAGTDAREALRLCGLSSSRRDTALPVAGS